MTFICSRCERQGITTWYKEPNLLVDHVMEAHGIPLASPASTVAQRKERRD